MLLIEANLDARARHESVLRAAGYDVLARDNGSDLDLQDAAVVVSDLPSFHWLQDQRIRRLPPLVVLSDDDRGGVTACLCGAAAWAPADGDTAYLLDTIDAVLHPRGPVMPRGE